MRELIHYLLLAVAGYIALVVVVTTAAFCAGRGWVKGQAAALADLRREQGRAGESRS